MERTLNKSQHTKSNLEKNIPAAPARILTHNLLIMSLALLPTSYPGRKKKAQAGKEWSFFLLLKNVRGDSKVESYDSPEIPDRGETSDIPSLPSGDGGMLATNFNAKL